MTTAVQQQQQQQLQHQLHQQHSVYTYPYHHHSHQHSHLLSHLQHQDVFPFQNELQQQQESEQQRQLRRSQPFKMNAEFWQQPRGSFDLHAAAALATNQLHHQHHQHHQQQQPSHSPLPQHLSQSLQINHNQQPTHLTGLAATHQEQQQQQPATSILPLSSQEQHQQNHHLLFNAAAAAAAAVHLSGVVKSNELQNAANNITATEDAVTVGNICGSGNGGNGDGDQSEHSAPTSTGRLGISVKQEVQASAAAANNQNPQQQLLPKFQPNVPNAFDVLHLQLQQQLQQQQHESASGEDGVEETDEFNNQLKRHQVSELSGITHTSQQPHHVPPHHPQAQPHHNTHPHHHQQPPTSSHSQHLQPSNGQKQQHDLGGAGPSSPLRINSIGDNVLAPLLSPQQSLTPSGDSSAPDTKYNSEKLVNEIQLQLSRSTSAAAISERTLEECWSTLQRLFMHKSAMQQIQQIPRVGPGAPGSMGAECKPHQCQQCMKSFSSNHQLVQHIRVHTGEKPYKCSYCDRRFKQLSHVQQHTRLHTGERPYKCHLPDCGRAFIQLSNLQQHLRNHDAQVERAKNRPFHCNICGKGFATESSLRTHTSKHAALIGGPNATSCHVCHKLFLGADALMEHMKHAHKEKLTPNVSSPYIDNSGSSCIQSSSNDQYLAKRRTANHPCPVCGKHYVNEGSLRKHLACHPETAQLTNSLRMWPCSVCQAVFTHENGLLTHMEHMRMDPKHQFAAQYVLSRAAAERRERDSLLAATLAASAVGGGPSGASANSSSGLLPLVGVTCGGSNSLCPSPSANSECSSTGHLSSSAASDQGSSIHLLSNSNNNNNNNNNNNCNNNKLNELLSRTSSNLHLSSQYGVGVDTDIHVANRMSLMAAASAAAAAVAASAGGVGVSSGGVNTGGVSGVSMTSPIGCVDSTRSSVQAAVVNLATAMRINQAGQHQQSGSGVSSGTLAVSVANGSGAGNTGDMTGNASNPQQQLHTHRHQQQQQGSTAEISQTSISTALTPSGLRMSTASPGTVMSSLQQDASAVNAVVTMTAMRDTMMRSNIGVVDPLSSMHQQLDQHSHSGHVQHNTANNTLQAAHANYGPHLVSGASSSHQVQQQVTAALQNPPAHAHHHPHLNQTQQPHSPETALRMQQHAEAILRSHTEAAFRLAASVAASNGVIGSGVGDAGGASTHAVISSGNNSSGDNGDVPVNSNTIPIKAEAHQTQQQQLPNNDRHLQQQQPLQHLQHSTSQQTQKLTVSTSLPQPNPQQSPAAASQQSQLTSDLSEAIRLQEQRLEQALRLHNDARALNFLTAAQQTTNTVAPTSVAHNPALQDQHQEPQQQKNPSTRAATGASVVTAQ
ncbi:uncharacterized protein LOC101462023 [Ceratitis capitata]|nr:uncharacterized protein LOC101462023 [Ceratitis capitata]